MGAWLAIGVVSVALALAVSDRDSGLRTWWALRGDLSVAQARIEQLRSDIADLERDSGGLSGEGEPFALERAIRERLVYARPGEILVRLGPPTAFSDASPRIP
jgi:hypothetical protein